METQIKLGLIILTCLFMYRKTIGYGYIIDDIAAVANNNKKTGRLWKDLWAQLRGEYYVSSKVAHSLNLFFHTLNCVLIYLVFKGNVGFLTALLFALNPINNQATVWLSGKPYAIATSMVLIGLLVWPLFPIMYGLTFFWSINTALAPLLFAVNKPHWLVLCLPLMMFLARSRYIPTMKSRKKCSSQWMNKIELRKLILVPKTFAYYLYVCLFPLRLGMCHSYLHTFGMSKEETEPWYRVDKFFWLGCLELAGISYYCIFHWSPIAFGLFWFTLFIVQWTNFIVMNHMITERYAYLANVGLMYAVANLTINTPFALAFLTFYAVRLWQFLPAYKDCMSYWKSNVDNFPDVAMGYNQYGIELTNFGNAGTALDIWVRGIQLRPNDFRLNYNTANLFASMGDFNRAKQFIIAAEQYVDKINSYDFWMKNINKMKEASINAGVSFN